MTGTQIPSPSPNFDDRPQGTAINTVIIHYTGMPSMAEALARLRDGSEEAKARGRVSAHYLIDEDGATHALVNEEKRAWHAGVSYWRGQKGVNDFSIGIELVNPGQEFGYHKFPTAQMDALIELCKGIMQRHPIKPERILAHSDVAPARKIDPGEKFNWKSLAKKHGIGVWPEPERADYTRAGLYLMSKSLLNEGFTTMGYDPEASLEMRCRAFNLHFAQSTATELSLDAAAMLSWHQRHFLK